MFKDRNAGAVQLLNALKKYRDRGVVVLSISLGGTIIGDYLAKYLNAQFSLLVAGELSYTFNPMANFGAITEDGEVLIFDYVKETIHDTVIDQIIVDRQQEISRQAKLFRSDEPLPEIKDKVVILVDDGITNGAKISVTAQWCRKQQVKKLIIATPVCSASVVGKVRKIADEAVLLYKPKFFYNVLQGYEDSRDILEEEVVQIMRDWSSKTAIKPQPGISYL